MLEIDQCTYRLLNWNILVHLPKTDINSTTPSCQRHAVFQSFKYENRKQDAATTTEHSKCFISFLKDKNIDNII